MDDRPKTSPPGSPEASEPSAQASDREANAPGPEGTVPGGHWLCSELVRVHWTDASGAERTQVANLEEIWPFGAILDAEAYVASGSVARLSPEADRNEPAANVPAGGASGMIRELHATVCECRSSATGFALSVEFPAGSEWDFERFPLSHAVNSEELQAKAAQVAAGDSPADPDSNQTGSDSSANSGPANAEDGDTTASRAAKHRAADEALEQGSLFCLALHATRR